MNSVLKAKFFEQNLPQKFYYSLLLGVFFGISASISSVSLLSYFRRKREEEYERLVEDEISRPIQLRSDEIIKDGIGGLIGNTPLIRINSLSDALGVEILGKAEFLNPGGSVKDRVALKIIEDAERNGLLYPNNGSCIFEGTVGSTGISLAMIARARGYNATIIMPDDVAEEKAKTLLALGANVEKVRPASIVDKKQFVNLARQRALEFGNVHNPIVISDDTVVTADTQETVDGQNPSVEEQQSQSQKPRGFFADQFESKSNFDAHYEGTGPELWRQTNGRIDAFVSGSGTGGTISGVGRFLKTLSPGLKVILADPEGSGLYNKVKYGVLFDNNEAEGTKRRHQVDTVVEGIGINRLTKNFEMGLPVIDDAYKIRDKEAVAMSRYLVQNDGLFLGSSSACNLVACVKLAKEMRWKTNQVIVTILCDSGTRHYSKFWNDDYVREAGIAAEPSLIETLITSL